MFDVLEEKVKLPQKLWRRCGRFTQTNCEAKKYISSIIIISILIQTKTSKHWRHRYTSDFLWRYNQNSERKSCEMKDSLQTTGGGVSDEFWSRLSDIIHQVTDDDT